MSNYHDIFSGWADVQREFNINQVEPDDVLYAYYSYEDYSGQADVFYWDDGKFYYVSGGHCSCYGLEEDQWNPEEYSVEALQGQIERATYGFFKDQKELIMAAIEKYQSPLAELAVKLGSLEGRVEDAKARHTAAALELDELVPQLEEVKGKMRQLLN